MADGFRYVIVKQVCLPSFSSYFGRVAPVYEDDHLTAWRTLWSWTY
jgi:hypothetical protein